MANRRRVAQSVRSLQELMVMKIQRQRRGEERWTATGGRGSLSCFELLTNTPVFFRRWLISVAELIPLLWRLLLLRWVFDYCPRQVVPRRRRGRHLALKPMTVICISTPWLCLLLTMTAVQSTKPLVSCSHTQESLPTSILCFLHLAGRPSISGLWTRVIMTTSKKN